MEPGGFEPPCPDSQPVASTCVVVLNISAGEKANDGEPPRHDGQLSRSAAAHQGVGAEPDGR